jgi:hypothetical protein
LRTAFLVHRGDKPLISYSTPALLALFNATLGAGLFSSMRQPCIARSRASITLFGRTWGLTCKLTKCRNVARPAEVDDLGLGRQRIGNHRHAALGRLQARGAPIDVDDPAFGAVDGDPVIQLIGLGGVEDDPGKHVAEGALQGQADNDRQRAGRGQHALTGRSSTYARAAMIAIRKITAPSRSCNSRPVCPTRCIIAAPINTVRVRAPNSHQPICNPVAARCNGTLSAHGAGSIGFKPSLNRRLNNENQHPHQQLPAIAIGTDQTPQPRSINTSAMAQISGCSVRKDNIKQLQPGTMNARSHWPQCRSN